MKHENKVKGRWDRLKILYDIGGVLLVSAAVLTFAKDRVVNTFTTTGISEFPVAQLSTLLLFLTIILIIRWMWAVRCEMQMLEEYFGKFIPNLPTSSLRITIGLSLLLGVLGYFSNRIAIYSAIFVTFKLFELWGTWVRDSQLKIGFDQVKNESSSSTPEFTALETIEKYYLKRPQVQLAVTVLFFTFISLILGLLGELLPSKTTSKWLWVGAYIVMIATIVVNEVVYCLWRRARNTQLGEFYS